MIQVKNLSKKYDIAHQRGGYVALRDVIATIARRPLRFAKAKMKTAIGTVTKEEFWALKDISFRVNAGDVVGIIGRNGAGKSTLLKILTGITPPTAGEAVMAGRVSSLLEVGTGFHPELTGRENIFLNGAILGMSRADMAKNFDAIVEFAGVEQFLDTPVKYYSSGMYVRLAFSVAAHLEPDILLVDEVLAVGDAEFQKKCLGKMEEVTKKDGRTILFVSHNMVAVQQLCKQTILLERGKIKMIGPTEKVVRAYLYDYVETEKVEWEGLAGDEHVRLTHTRVRSMEPAGRFHTAAPIEIEITADILQPVRGLIFGFTLFSEFGYELAYTLYDDAENSLPPTVEQGPFIKKFIIPANTLSHGTYRIEPDIGIHEVKRIVQDEGQLVFTVEQIAGLGLRFPLPHGKGRSSFFRPAWAQEQQHD
ncbi:MAG: ABC transporter ATP-binding protein [Candidatus Sungbacteria bacterium]|nr:ABC transporter ATP-binding protein [Candidatus Sungbacteria bacterium]